MMDKTPVLLTGAAGRIGKYLTPAFAERYDLRTFDRVPVPHSPREITGDLTDFAAVKAAMERVEVVVHLAAQPDEAPFVEKLLQPNIIGLFNTLQAAHETGVRRVVFASTVQTVDAHPPDTVHILPTDPPRPNTKYGVTKVFGETLGRWFHDKHGLEFIALRIGAFQPVENIQNVIHHQGMRNIWLSPNDAIQLFEKAIETPGVGYAVVFGTSVTLRERLDLADTRRILNYDPQDDIRTYMDKASGGLAGDDGAK